MFRTIYWPLLLLLPFNALAQSKKGKSNATNQSITIPLKPEAWSYKEGKAEFITHKSRPAIKLSLTQANIGAVLLRGLDFTNGTIEYDVELLQKGGFAPIYFRWQDSANQECFYLRNYRAGNPKANDAVQYAPIIKGAWLWNAYYDFQSAATLNLQQWNHIKLVLSGRQMRVYVNNSDKPTLQVPRLEGDATCGAIGFDGNIIISNLVVKPNQVEGLSPLEGTDLTDNDARYLRAWQVSQPLPASKGIDFTDSLKPNEKTVWELIEAERRGLVNLSRRFGKTESRKIVWLKTTLYSAVAQSKELDLGFSEEVAVFINGRLLYTDKNLYTSPIRKEPDGRLSVENTSVVLPLRQGDNELVIGVANSNPFGWGMVARLAIKEGDAY